MRAVGICGGLAMVLIEGKGWPLRLRQELDAATTELIRLRNQIDPPPEIVRYLTELPHASEPPPLDPEPMPRWHRRWLPSAADDGGAGGSSKGYWRIAGSQVLGVALSNTYWERLGLKTLTATRQRFNPTA